MILRDQLILNTKPNKNRRRYTIEALESIVKQILNDQAQNLGTLGTVDTFTTPLNKVAFRYFNPRIEEESLYVDIEILDTPSGRDLKNMLDSVVFRVCGTIEHASPAEPWDQMRYLLKINLLVGGDYKLTTLNAINKDEDSLEP